MYFIKCTLLNVLYKLCANQKNTKTIQFQMVIKIEVFNFIAEMRKLGMVLRV